jgi:hypothetical protein
MSVTEEVIYMCPSDQVQQLPPEKEGRYNGELARLQYELVVYWGLGSLLVLALVLVLREAFPGIIQ